MHFGVVLTSSITRWSKQQLTDSSETCDERLYSSRLGFCSSDNGEVFLGPSRCDDIHHRLIRHNVTWSRGCWNTRTRKKNKIDNEQTSIVSVCWTHGDTDIFHLGFHKVSPSKSNSIWQLQVHSTNHRVSIGVMDVHDSFIDHWSKGILVISIFHQTTRSHT